MLTHASHKKSIKYDILKEIWSVKGFIVKLTPSHVQSAWGSREESVRVAGLAACCNYFKKKMSNMIKLQPVLASNKIIIKLICRISLLKREHLEVLRKIRKITMT